VPVDVALPCATQNELDADDAKRLVANGVLCVAEGANMPSTVEAVEASSSGNGVLYAPGKASNAGGVATSGLEMSQNAMRLSWTREEVDARLLEIMRGIHAACLRTASAQTAGQLRRWCQRGRLREGRRRHAGAGRGLTPARLAATAAFAAGAAAAANQAAQQPAWVTKTDAASRLPALLQNHRAESAGAAAAASGPPRAESVGAAAAANQAAQQPAWVTRTEAAFAPAGVPARASRQGRLGGAAQAAVLCTRAAVCGVHPLNCCAFMSSGARRQ
jgi:hypothetical protein